MTIRSQIEQLHQKSYGHLVATLTRLTGELTTAEDAVQDAFASAIADWSEKTVPDNPVAWLARAARNKAIDRLRRNTSYHERLQQLSHMTEFEEAKTPNLDLHPALRDDMLRLIFTCCHPALNDDARVALSLNTICGLDTNDIAKAFIVPEPTMAQRLVRAKRKIREAGIAYRVPDKHDLDERLSVVFSVIYLIFNEAYLPARGSGGVNEQLAVTAIGLARTLCLSLTEKHDAEALLALMLFSHSRRDARFGDDDELIRLGDQDRTLWKSDEIIEANTLIHQVFDSGKGQSRYAIQAAIASVHASANTAEKTDWPEICQLYEYLMDIDPSPVVALNHAVAVAERDGAQAGLTLVNSLCESKTMQRYYLFHAARADLLTRCKRFPEAATAYRRALDLATNDTEREFLIRQSEQSLNPPLS